MDAAGERRASGRGPELLVTHCAALDGTRMPVADRLQRLLGTELTRLLVVALAGGLYKPPRF